MTVALVRARSIVSPLVPIVSKPTSFITTRRLNNAKGVQICGARAMGEETDSATFCAESVAGCNRSLLATFLPIVRTYPQMLREKDFTSVLRRRKSSSRLATSKETSEDVKERKTIGNFSCRRLCFDGSLNLQPECPRCFGKSGQSLSIGSVEYPPF